MANKFLEMVSEKVQVNKNKLTINTSDLGLSDNTKYEVVPDIANSGSTNPSLTFTSGIAATPVEEPSGN